MRQSYQCPGESYPISRAVHLARLAAGYAPCDHCRHFSEQGTLPVERPPALSMGAPQPLFETDRVWRSERNASGRRDLLAAATAVAAVLTSECPWELPASAWEGASARAPSPPRVVLGHDGELPSQRLAGDVARTFSRAGCRVISIGASGRPAFELALESLAGRAGAYVESGGSPAGSGFSIVDGTGIPWSTGGELDRVAARMSQGSGRAVRTAPAMETFDATDAYCELLSTECAGLAEMTVGVIGLSTPMVRCWERIAPGTGLRLEQMPGPRLTQSDEPSPAAVRRLLDAIVRNRWSGGVIVGPDGRQAWVVDRRDGLLTSRDVGRRWLESLGPEARERRATVVVYEPAMWLELDVGRSRLWFCPPTQESLVRAMRAEQAVLGADGMGRFWTGGARPRCDALGTIAAAARAWGESAERRPSRAAG
ncbi:MAG: hypothetical protein KF774_10225 [Planctomyces sp.]|nr:hypothetical protein [Planctomyces sp.]